MNDRASLQILRVTVVALLFSVTVGSTPCQAQEHPSEMSAGAQAVRISFNEKIRPIFARHCVACHGGVKQASGLSLIYREQALATADSGLAAIVPGQPTASYLLDRVADPDRDSRMPPGDHGPPLTAAEQTLLVRWIEQGAVWEEPWAFIPPQAPLVPPVDDSEWPRDTLDNFILEQLEACQLTPAAEAERHVWLRRATLDLTGVPPSLDEYRAFEQDLNANARDKVVDRLLASPRFGERWAAMWLDLARYADTAGFERDPHRDVWPFRDWVIRALNDDMPFDQFTVKQLAGDLLPTPTLGDRLATAFHRNSQTNTEGGTDDEEFRTAAVIDRVNTTWQTWQATTFGCAQCHSHPYDPISNEEFYKFAAIFNTSRDEDVNEEFPLLSTPFDCEQWEAANKIDQRMRAIRHRLFELESELAADESQWRRLSPSTLDATGETKLVSRIDPVDGAPEFATQGTVSAYGTFTIDCRLVGVDHLTAIRLEALPTDVAEAVKIPDAGFVLSRCSAVFVDCNGTVRQEIPLEHAFGDEPEALMDPQESLLEGDLGWAQYARMNYPRSAVLLLAEPLTVDPADSLRLSLGFDRTDSGEGALAIQRGRISVSGSERWSQLLLDAEFRSLHQELARLKEERQAIDGVAVPVMAEAAEPFVRKSFQFARGNWMNKEAEVQPGLPAVLDAVNRSTPPNRLTMAQWLVSGQNPLTARVMVNRLWQELFGVGIVETAEDFGTSGSLPSHPELLDHLALRFQNEYRWSLKKLLRVLVLSATYSQAGVASPEKIAADPRNRLLSRGPRTRLTAEMVRDQSLALSGRLSAKMYGTPVMPPQPEGVWRTVYSGAQWIAATGDDRYRRAIYTYCRRTSGYPSFLAFDMPSRDVCSARRIATNTPLQALATLNDEAHLEFAQGLAERMKAADAMPAGQIAAGYEIAVGHALSVAWLERLQELYEDSAADYDAHIAETQRIDASREGYALTIVASALLNLDEVLTK